MGAVTLKDVAAKLGLSITTVLRALAGYDDVAEATRQRVLQAAAEMGYVPNVTVRRLQKGRTDTIGFVIPTLDPRFSDPFFSELLAGIGNEAARHNYDLLVSTRPPDTPEEDIAYCRLVEGLIQLIHKDELAERHVLLQPELIVRESSGAGQDGQHSESGLERR